MTEKEEDGLDTLIIHNKCGLPIEFCECPDATIKYDWDKGVFNVKEKEKE